MKPRSDTMHELAFLFLEWMRIKNYSDRSVETRELYLSYFFRWCDDRGLLHPAEITKPIVERYQRYMFYYRKRDGRPLSVRSQYTRLITVKVFFRWLAGRNYILSDPASAVELPQLPMTLPKDILTTREADKVINVPDVSDPVGIRDRAILETFYSTGIRRSELISLTIHSVDLDGLTVMIRRGKGMKDRRVPIGERAVKWIEKYLFDVRPQLTVYPDEGFLFLTSYGGSFNPGSLTNLVSRYIRKADVGKTGSCHLFRHSMATHMFENGADIRCIQEVLGHSSIESTQVYTHLSIKHLQEVHTRTHPANRKTARKRHKTA